METTQETTLVEKWMADNFELVTWRSGKTPEESGWMFDCAYGIVLLRLPVAQQGLDAAIAEVNRQCTEMLQRKIKTHETAIAALQAQQDDIRRGNACYVKF